MKHILYCHFHLIFLTFINSIFPSFTAPAFLFSAATTLYPDLHKFWYRKHILQCNSSRWTYTHNRNHSSTWTSAPCIHNGPGSKMFTAVWSVFEVILFTARADFVFMTKWIAFSSSISLSITLRYILNLWSPSGMCMLSKRKCLAGFLMRMYVRMDRWESY